MRTSNKETTTLCTQETCATPMVNATQSTASSPTTMLCTLETCSSDIIPSLQTTKEDLLQSLEGFEDKGSLDGIFQSLRNFLKGNKSFEKQKSGLEEEINDLNYRLQRSKENEEKRQEIEEKIDLKEKQLELMNEYGQHHREAPYLSRLRLRDHPLQ